MMMKSLKIYPFTLSIKESDIMTLLTFFPGNISKDEVLSIMPGQKQTAVGH